MNTSKKEIERKFLLKKYPDILNIDGYFEHDVVNSDIHQYYLDDGSRIRREVIKDPENGVYKNTRVEFTHTTKTGEGVERNETVRHIDLEEFSELKERAVSYVRKGRETIKFEDYNLVFDSFQNISMFLMEIEVLPSEHGHDHVYDIEVPEPIIPDVVMEVTPFEEFKNKRLAVKL